MRWRVIETASGCGATVEADDAAAACAVFWRFYRPGPVPDAGPEHFTIAPAEGDTMSKLADLERRLDRLETQMGTAAPARIIVEYTLPDGTVTRTVTYGPDGTVQGDVA